MSRQNILIHFEFVCRGAGLPFLLIRLTLQCLQQWLAFVTGARISRGASSLFTVHDNLHDPDSDPHPAILGHVQRGAFVREHAIPRRAGHAHSTVRLDTPVFSQLCVSRPVLE